MFSLFGAVGILLTASIGGALFDDVSRIGPFMLVGASNFVVMILAIIVLKMFPDPDHMKGARASA